MINNLRRIRKKLAILFLLIILGHVACKKDPTTKMLLYDAITPTDPFAYDHAPPVPQPTLHWTPALENLQANLLGASCIDPCWFGIIPGKTPADQVPQLLDELKREGVIEEFNLAKHPISTHYSIRFTPLPDHLVGRLDIDEERNIVTDVSFTSYSKFISLNGVIDAFGEPELIAEGGGDNFKGVYLGYPEEDISLSVRTDSLVEEALSPDMNVIDMRYLSEFANNHEINSPDITWVEWEGYQTFAYYIDKIRAADD